MGLGGVRNMGASVIDPLILAPNINYTSSEGSCTRENREKDVRGQDLGRKTNIKVVELDRTQGGSSCVTLCCTPS